MSAVSTSPDKLAFKPRRNYGKLIRRVIRLHPNMMLGAVFLLIVVIAAVFSEWIMTESPTWISPADRLQAPGGEYLLGTDGQGRDVFSRMIKGSQLSLTVGLAVSVATMIVGGVIGLISGFSRKFDNVAMRLMDALMAFPSIILAIAIMAARGPSVWNVVFALTVVNTPRMARVVRSVVQNTAEAQYVEAAQSIGASTPRMLFRHITPNCLSPVIVQTSFVFADAVLGEATLSFLGAGAPPDIPSWGGMLAESRVFLAQAPWTMLVPGAALTITVFALNLIGDGIRDMLDPRLRHR